MPEQILKSFCFTALHLHALHCKHGLFSFLCALIAGISPVLTFPGQKHTPGVWEEERGIAETLWVEYVTPCEQPRSPSVCFKLGITIGLADAKVLDLVDSGIYPRIVLLGQAGTSLTKIASGCQCYSNTTIYLFSSNNTHHSLFPTSLQGPLSLLYDANKFQKYWKSQLIKLRHIFPNLQFGTEFV